MPTYCTWCILVSEIRLPSKIIPARDPNQWGGAKGDETSGCDDDDDDTQMRAQRRAHIGEHTEESTHMRGHRRRHIFHYPIDSDIII